MSDEFFTVVDGIKTDAPLHDDILDNPEADLSNRIATARRAIADGMGKDDARLLYGISKGTEL
jgi:hypothetical protein